MSDDFAAKYPLRISREQGRNAFGDALRKMVGYRKRISVTDLAKDSGVPEWQIRAAMIDGGSPDNRPLSPEALLSIMLCLGADFTNRWIGQTQQGAFDLPDDEPDPGDLAADTADDTATVVRAARDRKFDRKEKPQLREVGARMMTRGAQLLAVAER